MEAGVDTWRTLWKAAAFGGGPRIVDLEDGYRGEWFPQHGVLAVEGHPDGPQVLARPDTLGRAFERVSELVAPFGATFLGATRLDLTVTHRFGSAGEGRAFFAGMAAMELPRCETTRRGSPVHSVWWTGAKGRAIKARVYDKGLERGTAEAFELGRLEDQRRFPSGVRPVLEAVTDGDWCRERFRTRFAPVAKAASGVIAAGLPVIAQAIADEARYGYRSWKDAERLAGSLVLLAAGGGEAYKRSTLYARRAALREAGYVLADEWLEPVEVNLGDVIEAALDAPDWG
jgi:hypothetical protein